jgi:hypothetical protein
VIKIISHRANLNGSNPKFENHIFQIDHVLSKGFDVEIDVWKLPDDENCFRLGHDKPILSESIPLWYLQNPKLLVHCKNQDAWNILSKDPLVNCFQHTEENWVKSTRCDIIVHGDISPGKFLSDFKPKENDLIGSYKSIIYTWFNNKEFEEEMKPSLSKFDYTIMTDYPISYKEGL